MSANGDVFNLMESVCFNPEIKDRSEEKWNGKEVPALGSPEIIRPENDEKEGGWKQKWHGVRESTRAGRHWALEPSPQLAYEQMLQLVQRIFLVPATATPKKVMFCGIDANNSSEICAHAARVLAEQTGSTVCLVDANMREHGLCKQFKLDEKKSAFGQQARWREQCLYVGKNLFVASMGLMGSRHGSLAPANEMKNRIADLSSSFEYLLFDAPGANISPDAALLGQIAGSAVLVLEANKTRRVEAKKAVERLQMANVRILGAVLQNAGR